jgi:purine-binding chemotaxis protein CheW
MIEEQVVIFRIQEEEYAIPLADTQGIIQCQGLKKLVSTSDYMESTINVHGRVIPVVRLSAKFGLAGDRPEDRPEDRRIIVAKVGSQEIGIIVDEVIEVLALAIAGIEPTAGGCSELGACIRGIGKIGYRLIILLDLARLFSAGDLAAPRTAG